MAVPKRFKFKSKKKSIVSINNNCEFITPLKNKYFLYHFYANIVQIIRSYTSRQDLKEKDMLDK